MTEPRGRGGGGGGGGDGGELRSGQKKEDTQGSKWYAKEREVVSGVRRVWGTLRNASHFSVKNTIVKISSVSNIENMEVKRKYTFTNSRKPKWWFVLRADEATLQLLQAE